jgi:hypothetical protein
VVALAVPVVAAGVALRLWDFGRYGFWNDEAWVALATRVEGFAQFWLAISLTPILWAAALRVLALLPSAPEVTLRLLPLGWSLATLWLAWRLGRELSGHALGGLLALVVIACDPSSIQYAKTLKPYGAEACLALLAFDALVRYARGPTSGALVRLALVSTLALPFATAQVFVAPPVLAAALVDALARRDRRGALGAVVAAALVGGVLTAYYAGVLAPRLPPSMTAYFEQSFVPATGVVEAIAAAGAVLRTALRPGFGPLGLALGVVSLAALAWTDRGGRASCLALALLVAELVTLSALRRFPFREPRVILFLLTLVSVHLAAALAFSTRRLWTTRPALAPALGLAFALLSADFVASHRWSVLGEAVEVEDLGPLVRQMDARREPADGVLVYARSVYVYAYYQRPTPVLLPGPQTVGFIPILADPVVIVGGDGAAATVQRAFTSHARVWFVGSRLLGSDLPAIAAELARHGDVVEHRERPNAQLFLVDRR